MFIRQNVLGNFLLEPIDPFWCCTDTLHLTVSQKKKELEPTFLRVADCACSIAAMVGLFQRLLFNKVLVPAIMEGGSSPDLVAGVCARSACDRWDR